MSTRKLRVITQIDILENILDKFYNVNCETSEQEGLEIVNALS